MTQADPASTPAPTASAALLARRAAWAVLAAALAGALLGLWPGLKLAEERSRDALTGLVISQQPVPGVAVVDISEESLRSIGVWPWSRDRLADLVEELLGPLGARAVALDMVLPERADESGDARLASIAQHGPLALAQVLDFTARATPIVVGTAAGGRNTPLSGVPPTRASGHVANHAGLAGARCVGHIGVQPDADGVLRRIHTQAQTAGRTYATLSLALMDCTDPQPAAQAVRALGAAPDGQWRIPFRRDVGAFLTVSAESVLRGQLDPALLRGRYVLIGSSAVGLSDYVATPLQPVTAGVLVHAQVMAELLEAAHRDPVYAAGGWLTLAASVLALAVLGGALALRVRFGVAALALLLAAWLALCAWAFSQGLRLLVLPPVGALIAYGLTWLALDFAHARAVSRRAMRTLSHYIAAPVLRLLVRQGLQETLVPSRRNITVLVADMAGYTRLTAESSLEQSARLTTEFLEAITAPVLAGGATLDRYTGDGLIAFWGAPLIRADHAQGATDAAVRMFDALKQFNTARAARGEPAVTMRIGIESGEALVGDLGSSARSVYTAVGTCINLASRLQELARDRGESVIIGPQAALQITTPLRPLGQASVRGLTEPINIYSIDLHADRI